MVLPGGGQTPSMSTHPYSHAIQLKLYQAFIFSIPILFSIILFLLFYLFYLKRRAYNLTTSSPSITRRNFRHPTAPIPLIVTMPCEMDLKGELKEKLPKVVFDEELRARDSLCCVCLGEFEMKEELIRMPSCKHMFHGDCISHWLQSNSTCPLCRSFVLLAAGVGTGPPISSSTEPNLQQPQISNHHQLEIQQQESSSSTTTSSSTTNGCSTFNAESVVIHVQLHPL